ncbi:Type IV secretory system Conjugative DNA transfer, partial [Roseomonas rosea]
MRAALLAVLDGVGFTWRLGTALVRAAIGGVVGLLSGLVVFALLGLLVPKEWGGVVWNGGAMLTGALAAVFAFLDSFRRPARPDVMGSAAWADARGVAAELAAPALARDPAALLVGRAADRRGEPLRYAGPAHLLTVAPTRSGKGVGTVLPNLLAAPRPVICVDPKGENSRIAAKARRRFGPVWVLDPFGASGQPAACYDPAALFDPLSPDLADDAT